MGRADLDTNSGRAVRHYRIKEANDVDAFLEHAGGKLLRFRCVANHDRDDGMNARFNGKPGLGDRFAKIFRVRLEFVAQLGRCRQHFQRFQASRHDRWRDGVGK